MKNQKNTQYDRIREFVKRRPVKGATYLEITRACGCNWPHKRITEMMDRGESIRKEWDTTSKPKCMRVWMA